MSTARRLAILATSLVVVVLLAWACAPDLDRHAFDPSTTRPLGGSERAEAPVFVPVTGAAGEEGQPEPPPIHAVFSLVVRGSSSWAPYGGPELTNLDVDTARDLATRLVAVDTAMARAGIPLSIELAYGPAAALCEVEPDLFSRLEQRGHVLGIHVHSAGEAFRARRALGACDRDPLTASGLSSMADPNGPAPPSAATLTDAFAMLSVLDIQQVVGTVSPLCTDLGLAEPGHGYGTGSFTAPWRSGWTEASPCGDLPSGRIVVIDQTSVVPSTGEAHLDASALSALRARTEQVLGYALDLRYREPEELPVPGVVTWGVTVRLDDLVPPPGAGTEAPDAEDEGDDEGRAGEEAEETEEAEDDDRLTGDDVLAALVSVAEELWQPNMEQGRIRWMLPAEVAAIIRPLPDVDAGS